MVASCSSTTRFSLVICRTKLSIKLGSLASKWLASSSEPSFRGAPIAGPMTGWVEVVVLQRVVGMEAKNTRRTEEVGSGKFVGAEAGRWRT